jgi:hypothetical protein
MDTEAVNALSDDVCERVIYKYEMIKIPGDHEMDVSNSICKYFIGWRIGNTCTIGRHAPSSEYSYAIGDPLAMKLSAPSAPKAKRKGARLSTELEKLEWIRKKLEKKWQMILIEK